MIEITKTKEFQLWVDKLKDRKAAARIFIRLDRVQMGNLGNFKNLGDSISELRINYGPGYRIYYTNKGNELVLLLIGGDKGSQKRDISKAKKILDQLNTGDSHE